MLSGFMSKGQEEPFSSPALGLYVRWVNTYQWIMLKGVIIGNFVFLKEGGTVDEEDNHHIDDNPRVSDDFVGVWRGEPENWFQLQCSVPSVANLRDDSSSHFPPK